MMLRSETFRITFRRSALAAAILAMGLGTSAAEAQDQASDVGDQTVLASVNVPSAGLACEDAGAQARITFKAVNIPFAVKRVSIFIDGRGVPQSGIEQAWPSIAVNGGLHAGRNVVEFVAYGPNNQAIDRKQVVLLGGQAETGDIAPAQIECSGEVASGDAGGADDQSSNQQLPAESDQQQSGYPDQQGYQDQQAYQDPQAADQVPPNEDAGQVDDQTYAVDPGVDPGYDGQPVYTYYPSPVFYGPVISAGYFGPPAVIYAPLAPFFVYRRWGPGYYGGNYGYRGGYYRGGYGGGGYGGGSYHGGYGGGGHSGNPGGFHGQPGPGSGNGHGGQPSPVHGNPPPTTGNPGGSSPPPSGGGHFGRPGNFQGGYPPQGRPAPNGYPANGGGFRPQTQPQARAPSGQPGPSRAQPHAPSGGAGHGGGGDDRHR